jgi:methylmalonyl-CoA/ethylmalonyl-CoA epimerase
MGLKRIDHIGVAVDDVEQVARIFTQVLGAEPAGEEELADDGLRVISVVAGDDTIELFEPSRADHTVRRFLDRRGNALHHICLEVDDLDAELARLTRLGSSLVTGAAPGADDRRVAFFIRARPGYLIELGTPSGGPSDLAPTLVPGLPSAGSAASRSAGFPAAPLAPGRLRPALAALPGARPRC